MKRILYFLVTFIEIVCLAGAYIFNYFTVRKLGMVRWVNYQTTQLTEKYPLGILEVAAGIMFVLGVVLAFRLFWKKRKQLKLFSWGVLLADLVMVIGYTGFIITKSFETLRAYHFVCLLLILSCFLQLVKVLSAPLVLKKKEIIDEE